ncbi:MAG: hypothetical protein LBB98_13960 [Treponema sp.]|jgi:hypothetical protein|nr:hypothetical protein [Treponema sp.]
MKHRWIAAVLFLLCGRTVVFGVELGVALGVMGHDPTLNEMFGTDADLMSFIPFGNAHTGFDITDNMGLTITVDQDPILKTRIMPVLGFTYNNIVNLKIGPFMGFPDIREIDVNPGISMTLDVAAPGVVFGSIRFDTTIGGGNIAPRNFVQELWEIKAGFWTPYIIFSLGAQNRSFTVLRESEIYTSKWTRYIFSMDFFQKNVPRTWRFDLGYQKLRWFPHDQPTDGYEYRAFFLGAEFHLKVNYTTEIIMGGEGTFFSWNPKNSRKWYTQSFVLFETRLGLVWSIGK